MSKRISDNTNTAAPSDLLEFVGQVPDGDDENITWGTMKSLIGVDNIPTADQKASFPAGASAADPLVKDSDSRLLADTVQTATFATPTSIDASLGGVVDLTLTGDTTINFTGAVDGQTILLRLRQDGTGGHSVTWGTMCRASSETVLPTVSAGANALDYIGFRYNSTDSKYDYMAGNQGF